MPSTATTPIAARICREDAEAVHEIARDLDVTTSTVTAGLVRYALSDQRRARMLKAVELLKRAQERPGGSREFRQLVIQAIECLDAD